MATSLYLINPRSSTLSYYGSEVFEHFGLGPLANIADLAVTTIAALAPDDFEVEVADEHFEEIDFDHPADYIGLTGKITQFQSMARLAEEFRARGKTVIMGGPYASLSPDVARPYADILVQGEIEDIAPKFFDDLRSGNWLPTYLGTQPDLRKSPIPRWDLYDNSRALVGAVQTSRGCPFECEFCDVIQYAGRKQRHKAPQQVIAELEVLYEHGYRTVFLADDNLTVFRRRARELLAAIRDWNAQLPNGHMRFTTQLSIDIADDLDMLRLCAEAGVTTVFIGIETPNEDSLKEAKKRQNVGKNLVDQIQNFTDHGIMVMGGMIVGFDNDTVDIFERQYNFAMQNSVPIFTLGALVAPDATPLRARLEEAGRIQEFDQDNAVIGDVWSTNIVPAQLTKDQLFRGIRWLANNLYAPEAFGQRMLHFIETYGRALEPGTLMPFHVKTKRTADFESMKLFRRFPLMGDAERKLWYDINEAMRGKPEVRSLVMGALQMYMQLRYMYDRDRFWEPSLAEVTEPLITIQ